jgi:ATP-dependent helicase YprA (DUF1998 family)
VTLIETKLQELADCGIAIHHAGLEYADRRAIEDAFREGQLYLIVSTSVSDRYPTLVISECALTFRHSPSESTSPLISSSSRAPRRGTAPLLGSASIRISIYSR